MTKTKKCKADGVKAKFSKARETDSDLDLPLWKHCANVMELSSSEIGIDSVPDRPVAKTTKNYKNISNVGEENKNSQLEILNLFQNAYSLQVYCELLG